jgi:EPS-associated MarR family transcriptional regulator
MNDNQDQFNVLRKIQKKPDSTQRELAKDLGFSLGKLNYCLRALNNKRLIKILNFKNNKNKISYIKKYVLTPKGIEFRINLTVEFMKRKIKEYDELKSEIKKDKINL